MMPELPKHVQVGPIRYRIDTSASAILQSKVDHKSTGLYGETDHKQQVIVIDPNQGADQLRDTLIHEVFHAVWFMGGLAAGEGTISEERVITTMATLWLDTMQRNPQLVAYLTQEAAQDA